MSDVNVVVISGTMGKSFSEIVKVGEREMALTRFSVASVDSYEGREKKTIATCNAWGEQLGREIQLLSEGDAVIVQGKLSSRKDKDEKWRLEVVASKVSLAGEPKRTEPLPF